MLETHKDTGPGSNGTVATKRGPHVIVPRKYMRSDARSVFDLFEWENRTAEIKNSKTGRVVFRGENLEFPKHWSQMATDITAEKYFRFVEQEDGSLKRETSVRQMVDRVAGTLARWGQLQGYFTAEHARVFYDELAYMLVAQKVSFNSPVWFNLGTKRGRVREEQCSACFINSVDDNMESILELGKIEGKLYKGGSGSGVNYSKLRSSRELLSGGGTASGPVPFIAKDDANAGALKSGGTTRRSAKMVILNVDHGDVVEFINAKANAERMAHALVDAGFDADFTARWGAYGSVFFQNANHSVRVTDEFMRAVDEDADWKLLSRDGKVIETKPAREIFNAICVAAWTCGDPGLQFDTLINAMHTTPAHGRINASNPCSEYMHLDDSACNLASLNLLKFRNRDGRIDVDDFNHGVDVTVTAMDIIVDGAAYPTPLIQDNAHRFRQLGLGYTNLGAYFMTRGMAYDSDPARLEAAAITALLCGRAYRRSAELARDVGAFEGFAPNRDAMLGVMEKHRNAILATTYDVTGKDTNVFADNAWRDAIDLGKQYGFRNAQATVLAPTGTISFMMDADTTGIEPEVALVKTKKLVGGGTLQIVNQRVEEALGALGYTEADAHRISEYVVKNGSVVGSGVKDEHLPVFDTAFADPVGKRSLRPQAHIFMMGAVQPFISGAISKTCNLPPEATVEDVAHLYRLSWQQGLKAVALYRDGCKRTQPLQAKGADVPAVVAQPPAPARRKLPADVDGPRHKFCVGDHEGYIHMGLFPEDGALGEIFIKMAKQGSTVGGLMDAFGIVTSIALQYGVPLELLVDKMSHLEFNPKGFTGDQNIGYASSIIDAVFRYLGHRFLKQTVVPVNLELSEEVVAARYEKAPRPADKQAELVRAQSTGNTCPTCGHITQRTGSCFSCAFCGWNGGCG